MSSLFRSTTVMRFPSLLIPMGLCVLSLFIFSNFSIISWNPGVVFQVETSYHSGSGPAPETAEMSVEGRSLKMEILSGSGADAVKDEVIFRGDRREMIVVDHEWKSYMIMNKKAIEGLVAQLKEAEKQYGNLSIPKEALKHLPEEKRKEVEALMRQQQDATSQANATSALGQQREAYQKTVEQAKKQGYPCVKYVVTLGNEKTKELWVTDWDNIDGGDEAKAAFKDMAAFFREMMEAFGKDTGAGDELFGGGNNPINDFLELDGFPIVTREFEDGELERESTLRSTKRRRLDPDAFEPPSGYKRRSMGPR